MARDPDAIEATSTERYNGGVAAKRRYGSSTITVFYVHRVRDREDPSRWLKIEVGGRTPGDRKTAAIAEFRERESELPK